MHGQRRMDRIGYQRHELCQPLRLRRSNGAGRLRHRVRAASCQGQAPRGEEPRAGDGRRGLCGQPPVRLPGRAWRPCEPGRQRSGSARVPALLQLRGGWMRPTDGTSVLCAVLAAESSWELRAAAAAAGLRRCAARSAVDCLSPARSASPWPTQPPPAPSPPPKKTTTTHTPRSSAWTTSSPGPRTTSPTCWTSPTSS